MKYIFTKMSKSCIHVRNISTIINSCMKCLHTYKYIILEKKVKYYLILMDNSNSLIHVYSICIKYMNMILHLHSLYFFELCQSNLLGSAGYKM